MNVFEIQSSRTLRFTGFGNSTGDLYWLSNSQRFVWVYSHTGQQVEVDPPLPQPDLSKRTGYRKRSIKPDILADPSILAKDGNHDKFFKKYDLMNDPAIDPSIKIIAPWKDPKWKILSREDAIDYCEKHNVPVTQTKEKIYSR